MIAHIVPALTPGGAEKLLLRMVCYDNINQHIVISLCGNNPLLNEFKDAGIKVTVCNINNLLLAPLSLFRMWLHLREIQPKVLMCWLYHGCAIGSLISLFNLKHKVIWCIHNANLDRKVVSWKVRVSAYWCGLLSHLLPDKIVYCSESAAKYHLDLGYERSVGLIIYNGIPSEDFFYDSYERIKFRKYIDAEETDLIICCIARFDSQKDHGNLFSALSLLKNEYLIKFKLVLCGSNMDPANAKLIEMIKNHRLMSESILLGSVSNLQSVYCGSDICVLSSRSEALPNVIGEAMLCNVFCVSTSVGDIPKIIGSEGWLVEPMNPSKLAEAIYYSYVKLNDFDSIAIKERARNRILKLFSFERMMNEYRAVWSK